METVQRFPYARLVPVDLLLARTGAQTAADLRLAGADALYAALATRLGVPLVNVGPGAARSRRARREGRDSGGGARRIAMPFVLGATAYGLSKHMGRVF